MGLRRALWGLLNNDSARGVNHRLIVCEYRVSVSVLSRCTNPIEPSLSDSTRDQMHSCKEEPGRLQAEKQIEVPAARPGSS